LARVFLIEPAEVEQSVRTKGASKRRRSLTYEELSAQAAQAGVSELYEHAVMVLEPPLKKHTTQSSIGFTGSFNGSRKIVISLFPGQSNAVDGLRYQLYKNRYAELTRRPLDEVERLIPLRHEGWAY